jgi:hypothetical protein
VLTFKRVSWQWQFARLSARFSHQSPHQGLRAVQKGFEQRVFRRLLLDRLGTIQPGRQQQQLPIKQKALH